MLCIIDGLFVAQGVGSTTSTSDAARKGGGRVQLHRTTMLIQSIRTHSLSLTNTWQPIDIRYDSMRPLLLTDFPRVKESSRQHRTWRMFNVGKPQVHSTKRADKARLIPRQTERPLGGATITRSRLVASRHHRTFCQAKADPSSSSRVDHNCRRVTRQRTQTFPW
jgi:hypothetical protein